ncbi:hypothetical protein VCR4J2_750251 [Vibrio coralliirubri]|nr:hypothetical protein VCR4J2_750251 [Vibrio coralliirubri]
MKYLSHYIQTKQTQAFNEAGAFFAFSTKQFDEAKKEGVKYASLGMGLICPVDNAEQLMNRLDSIAQEGSAETSKRMVKNRSFAVSYSITSVSIPMTFVIVSKSSKGMVFLTMKCMRCLITFVKRKTFIKC